MTQTFKLSNDEYLYGGTAFDGAKNPFSATSEYYADFRIMCMNQTMPLYLSTKGRYFYSETPFAVKIKNGEIAFEGGDVKEYWAGTCLRDAYLAAMKAHFPFDGRHLPEEFFRISVGTGVCRQEVAHCGFCLYHKAADADPA